MWVKGDAGGPGLEHHQFDHIDMPLDEVTTLNTAPYKSFFQESGFYILGKFPNKEKNEIHLTAFKVSGSSNLNYFAHTQGIFTFEIPKMVTVYTPGGILHTNNYQVCTVHSSNHVKMATCYKSIRRII